MGRWQASAEPPAMRGPLDAVAEDASSATDPESWAFNVFDLAAADVAAFAEVRATARRLRPRAPAASPDRPARSGRGTG